ncbi:MAG: hypothetical protein QXF82_08150, partial [Nitrososphaeria archaeon]
SVDKSLIAKKKIFHSRDPDEIVNHLLATKKRSKELNTSKSKRVKDEVIDITSNILSEQYKIDMTP